MNEGKGGQLGRQEDGKDILMTKVWGEILGEFCRIMHAQDPLSVPAPGMNQSPK